MPHTVTLHRVVRAPASRLYRAFVDADALCKWMAPHGYTAHVDHLDARVGGTYRMYFTNFSSGTSHSFGGRYIELVEGEKLVYDDQFDDPAVPGIMTTTITLSPVSVGTELRIEQSGIPDMIPSEACYLGWQESLELLIKLVEPEIPDGL
ncbi:SRPBCC family protein [Nitrogeniibacter aestuarii]|uniref:SRPBCC family protein n=1 Tax=Nitrogeniibacter aestuarii TaxID=2815343 RepID=UPI001D0F680E|nr:SRPBCC family protein [Nitrogeniibacter aestuarii]